MIIQTAATPAGPFFAIRMDEHTELAAEFARAFGNERFEPVEPREVMLDVIANHDKGWMEFDADPLTDPRTGLPYNLVDTPAAHITRTSSASPDFNQQRHPYAGLISSMHSWGLYNGRYGMSEMVLIDTIAPAERHLAERMLAGEIGRQQALKAKLAADPLAGAWCSEAQVFQNYKQLQFFDTLALYFNRTHEGARKETRFTHVPLNASADATVTITPRGHGVYAVAPYPFAQSPAEFSFAGRYLERAPAPERASWRETLRDAPVQRQKIALVAA